MIEMILRLHHEGKTPTQIAMLAGVHLDQVLDVLAEVGLEKVKICAHCGDRVHWHPRGDWPERCPKCGHRPFVAVGNRILGPPVEQLELVPPDPEVEVPPWA